jgi:hypothetical protein
VVICNSSHLLRLQGREPGERQPRWLGELPGQELLLLRQEACRGGGRSCEAASTCLRLHASSTLQQISHVSTSERRATRSPQAQLLVPWCTAVTDSCDACLRVRPSDARHG